MKDVQGTELELGQKVAFTVGTEIRLGVVERIRTANRYNHEYEVAKVRLAVPETVYGQAIYLRDETGNYRRNPDGSVMYRQNENRLRLYRDIDASSRIIVIPEVAK